MNRWWEERAEPWLVLAGERWAERACNYLRAKFDIPRRNRR
jgi:hypothetical protein